MEKKEEFYFQVIDMSVSLPKNIPSYLDYIIERCEMSALLEDPMYYEWADCLDVTCKNAYAAGEISKEDWDTYTRRYHQ